jgi:hypothetical protein
VVAVPVRDFQKKTFVRPLSARHYNYGEAIPFWETRAMAVESLACILRQLRRLAEGPAASDLSDGELLERFRRQGEEAAFTLLVQRHSSAYGRRVWSGRGASTCSETVERSIGLRSATVLDGNVTVRRSPERTSSRCDWVTILPLSYQLARTS